MMTNEDVVGVMRHGKMQALKDRLRHRLEAAGNAVFGATQSMHKPDEFDQHMDKLEGVVRDVRLLQFHIVREEAK